MPRGWQWLAWLALALAACAPPSSPPVGQTPAPAPSAPAAGMPGAPFALPTFTEPTAAPPCVNDLRWERDLTIPDGTNVRPGDVLDKRWLVTNNGTCNWDAGYRIKLIGGPSLGAPAEQALYPARSGTQFALRIVFTAPSDRKGTVISAWQAFDPQGNPFGDPVYIQIYVRQP